MLKTPEAVQQGCGIPAEAGRGRAIPRALYGYSGSTRRDKQQFLATAISMTMAGCLPEHGAKARARRDVNQAELAARNGLSRPSFTRRLSRFANSHQPSAISSQPAKPSPGIKERRGQESTEATLNDGAGSPGARAVSSSLSLRSTPLAAGESHKPDSPAGARPVLIRRERRFAAPNIYNYAFDVHGGSSQGPSQSADGDAKRSGSRNGRSRISLDVLRAHPELARLWADDAGAGYKDVPEWVWDPRLPWADTTRLVLTYYIMIGMLDPVCPKCRSGIRIWEETGRRLWQCREQACANTGDFMRHRPEVRGVVNPRQATVAKALGLSVKTIYQANKELEGKGPEKWGVYENDALVAWYGTQAGAEREAGRRNKALAGHPASLERDAGRRNGKARDVHSDQGYEVSHDGVMGRPCELSAESAGNGDCAGDAPERIVRSDDRGNARPDHQQLDHRESGAVGRHEPSVPYEPHLQVRSIPRLALIRVAHTAREVAPRTWRQGPCRIIYLPVRNLTEEEAAHEQARLAALVRARCGASPPRGMIALAAHLHGELLRAWKGKEHRLRAFWSELRRQMASAGVHRQIIEELVPAPPE